ncbi:MAG: flagellar biosynthesis protein FlhA [Planctomycetota bacterium]
MAAVALERFAKPFGANRDLVFMAAVIGMLLAILLPLPTLVIDALLSINITLALLILLTAIYVKTPLDFSVFPSLLLVTTLFRLALNIASTRLILANAGDEKELAAGRVIQVFGETVSGNNPLVGFILFVVIVVIQFVVITKGATRIAEVAARFTLDKMPGQQLSIDADLNAGLIDEKVARQRREQISHEADFYGSMDGASKFVRGDAIAGIIITIINLVAGFILGMTQYGMDFGTAVRVFSTLTIGDGLVSQVPALIVSIAAAMIVTRQTGESNLGFDLLSQMFSSPRAVGVTAVFLLLLLPLGLPWYFLIFGAGTLGGAAYFLGGAARVRESTPAVATEQKPTGPAPVTMPPVDPLELEVGYRLVSLVDQGDGGGLLQRIALIRDQIASELGLVIPPVRIRDNMQFKPSDYALMLRGQKIAGGTILVDHYLAMDSGLGLEALEGVKTKEPAFGIDAVWISEEHKSRAEAMGYTVVDGVSVISTHLTEVLRDHAAELLTREEVTALLQKIKAQAPAVVNEVTPELLKTGDIQKVLQNLLREKVPIRDLEAILESLADWAPKTKDPEVLTEYARHALQRTLCSQYADKEQRLHVITLDPRLEDYVQNAVEHTERGSFLRLSPEMQTPIVRAVTRALEALVAKGHAPVILSAPQVRLQVRRLLESHVPGVVTLSYNEVVRGVTVESLGVAKIE